MIKKRALVATVVSGVAFAGMVGATLTSQGCQLQGVCQQSSAWWPGPTPSNFPGPTVASLPNSGLVDENTWQSGSTDDPWLYFPGNRTYTIFPFTTSDPATSQRFFGPDWDITVWIGTNPQPTTTGNYTTGSGNPAEVFLVTDPSPSQYAAEFAVDAAAPVPVFNVVNASCADYYMRVEVVRHPGMDAGPIEDAAPDSPPDSGPDASLDGGVNDLDASSSPRGAGRRRARVVRDRGRPLDARRVAPRARR